MSRSANFESRPYRPPAFQFYARDWLSSASVRNMSARHRGVYISILAAMWDSTEPGTLSLPIKIAARSAGLDPRSLSDFVSKWPQCLIEVDGKLVNQKLRTQWLEMLQRHEILSDAGVLGNEKKKEKASGGDSGSESGGGRSSPAVAVAPSPAQKESLSHVVSRPSAETNAACFPDWIPTDAWLDFIAMRKLIGAQMTPRAADIAIRTLLKLKSEGHDPREVLEQSILNSWKGLFPIKKEKQRANGMRQSADEARERIRRNIRNSGLHGPHFAGPTGGGV